MAELESVTERIAKNKAHVEAMVADFLSHRGISFNGFRWKVAAGETFTLGIDSADGPYVLPPIPHTWMVVIDRQNEIESLVRNALREIFPSPPRT